ncbi:MAG TPA: DUF2520 domain-containing protein [Nitrospirota bacterium]|nr:DUF2520 domain-containing protein [Nitrospirota bacterium]
MNIKTVAIIGAGRVGSSVGYLLKRAGYPVTAVVARTMASAVRASGFIGEGKPATDAVMAAAGAELVFITTPDGIIKEVCDKIAAAAGFRPGALVIHMSGAHELDLLNAARRTGAYRAVLHPLQSLASCEQGAKMLPGSYFRIEADPEVLKAAKDIVKALGGIELVMPKWSSHKDSAALYHAGAVAVSNYFVALVDYGLKFYQALGADKKEALKAVLPLIRGTLHNIETLGIPDALTGPIMRGDTQTVLDHVEAMRRRAPDLLSLYKDLARQTVSVARERGSISQDKAEELLKLVVDKQEKPFGCG